MDLGNERRAGCLGAVGDHEQRGPGQGETWASGRKEDGVFPKVKIGNGVGIEGVFAIHSIK